MTRSLLVIYAKSLLYFIQTPDKSIATKKTEKTIEIGLKPPYLNSFKMF
jgi:hypothetical protein